MLSLRLTICIVCACILLSITSSAAKIERRCWNSKFIARCVFDIPCPNGEKYQWGENWTDPVYFDADVFCPLEDDSFEELGKCELTNCDQSNKTIWRWGQDGVGKLSSLTNNDTVLPEMELADGKYQLIIGDADDGKPYNIIIYQDFPISQVKNATHLSFQFRNLGGFPDEGVSDTPVLFVTLGKTTVAAIEIEKGKEYNYGWTLMNIPLEDLNLTTIDDGDNTTVPVGFRFMHKESMTISIDTVRFVKYNAPLNDNTFIDFANYKKASEEECAPGCIIGKDNETYEPRCDNIACNFTKKWFNHTQHDITIGKNRCIDGHKAGKAFHKGVCHGVYSSSCCTSAYDEDASYYRDKGEIDKMCDPKKLNQVCRRLMDQVRCAYCNPNSTIFTDKGYLKICRHFARRLYKECQEDCPQMKDLDRDTFFSSTGLGFVDDAKDDCFDGDETPYTGLRDKDIIIICVCGFLAFVIVAVIIVFVIVHSYRYGKKIDDKENDSVVVAPQSAAATTQTVEMNTVSVSPSVQSVQSADQPISMMPMPSMNSVQSVDQNMASMDPMQMQQMQMQMMMMNSAMNPALNTQYMMASGNLTSVDGDGSHPELNATVKPQ